MRYLITFTCYGTHLHGHESGTVDRTHNSYGTRTLQADAKRVSRAGEIMKQMPFVLDRDSRGVVLQALCEVCTHRGWNLLAAHVRTNHVNVVVDAEAKPEKIMNDLKSYASRNLSHVGLAGAHGRRWAHHGSTRWLWKDDDVREAIRYVVDEQGEAMAVFVGGPL